MPEPLLIGRWTSGGTRLPILLRVPVPGGPLVLATRESWPVTKDLFCIELPHWPDEAEVLETVPVASCTRVGASVQMVLDRAQRRRSLFVWTRKGDRELIFWRSERSMRSTRPGVRTPTARGLDGPLTVVVDERERYAWRFAGRSVTIERGRLPSGDYGVFDDGVLVAVVERKRLQEFAGDAIGGTLQLAMAELASMPRATLVVEGRLSQLLKTEVPVQPGWLLNLVAALQAANPNVPILFAETGPLAADLAYRWLSACLRLRRDALAGRSSAEAIAAALAPRAAGPRARADRSLAVAREAPLFDGLEARPRTLRRADVPPDRAERRRQALACARAGEALTIAGHARHHGIDPSTAATDLRALERDGLLRAEGSRRTLRFLAVS
jgi:hypothetical protein